MEISKALQEEILSVQNNLKNAIRNHQICVEKLNDDPNNSTVLDQIKQIQLHIVSLGRRQKQVVQRLRKEVETLKAENANGAKVSVASLLGLNNNNHITINNEIKRENSDSKDLKNINDLDTRLKKEDYEEEIQNDVSPPENDCSNPALSNSAESISYEDDIAEVTQDEILKEKQDLEDVSSAVSLESSGQISFLEHLGLITSTKCAELRNRKQERKRRSTTNPQFVYSNWELPTKRKRYSYLQSVGNAPQTRQSTARSNGPSPPPEKILSNKLVPPSTKNVSKSIISTQKSTIKPNILRNAVEKQALKSGSENGASQVQSSKSVGSKVVHIPGLPTSLTIERIESDTAVCINCKNPGTLTICQQCSSKYHVSCHSVCPPPPKICPKCALDNQDNEELVFGIVKKENELAAATNAAGNIGKAGEDSEVHKASRGFHKINAAPKRTQLPSTFGFNQLPSATFLFPLSSNSIPTVDQPDITPMSQSYYQSDITPVSQSYYQQDITPMSQSYYRDKSDISYVGQQSQSGSFAYVQPESHISSSYQMPVGHDKNQSYLVVKKFPETINIIGRSDSRRNPSNFNRQTETQNMPLLNYQLSSPCGYSTTHGEPEYSFHQSTSVFPKFRSRLVKSNALSGKKRILPELNRTVFSTEKMLEPLDSTSDEDIPNIVTRKNVPGRGGIFHSLFTGNNKSDIVASGSGQSKRVASDRENDTKNQHLCQVHQPKSNERTEQLQHPQRSDSAEHVKLEEAHISAPSRAKLDTNSSTRKKRGNYAIANRKKKAEKPKSKAKKNLKERAKKKVAKVQKVEHEVKETKVEVRTFNLKAQAVTRNVMEVTLDHTDKTASESQEKSSKETDREIVKDKDELTISLTKEQPLVSEELQTFYMSIQTTLDFIIAEREYSNSEDTEHMGSASRSFRSSSSEPLQVEKQSNIIELHTEVSVSDDKAEVENQDLLSGNPRRLLSEDDIVPDCEMLANSDQINELTTEIKETVIVNSVSDENIKVLEQYEAIMEVEKGSMEVDKGSMEVDKGTMEVDKGTMEVNKSQSDFENRAT